MPEQSTQETVDLLVDEGNPVPEPPQLPPDPDPDPEPGHLKAATSV